MFVCVHFFLLTAFSPVCLSKYRKCRLRETVDNRWFSDRGLCFKGTCHFDDSSEADVEAAPDPFLCPFVSSSGPVYLKGNLYGPDPFEVYLPGMVYLA